MDNTPKIMLLEQTPCMSGLTEINMDLYWFIYVFRTFKHGLLLLSNKTKTIKQIPAFLSRNLQVCFHVAGFPVSELS